MSTAQIQLKDVCVRFKAYHGYSDSLKELAMCVLAPPAWKKKLPPQKKVFWGLNHINLTLKEGDRLGIVGHNGAGKSTLLKVISRIYRPTRGTISIQGRLAPLIEVGAGFHPELSGRENIYLNGSIIGISKKILDNRLKHIVEFAGLEKFIDTPVKYYSTGMHLRLGFSIATEVSPDILILDELFTGGDAAFLKKANERMNAFIGMSKILILVTHNLKYLEQYCNRALLLDHGVIRKEGSPKEIVEAYLQQADQGETH